MEILIVIVIIAVLAILSMAGFRKIRATADKAVSIGNLKGLQLANANYASDHNGRYVSSFAHDEDGKIATSWDINQDFLEIFRGPSTKKENGKKSIDVQPNLLDPVAYRGNGKNRKMLRGSYGMPEVYGVQYGAPNADSSLKLTQLATPGETAAFVTGLDWHITYGGRLKWDGTEGPVGQGITAYRHGGKALVVYYDGRVGELTMDDMKRIDDKGGEEHPFWKGF